MDDIIHKEREEAEFKKLFDEGGQPRWDWASSDIPLRKAAAIAYDKGYELIFTLKKPEA